MKRAFNWLVAGMLCLALILASGGALAESEAEDSEAALRELIGYMEPNKTIGSFFYGDYDGDGIHEAFALLDERDDWGFIEGDLWFASPLFCEALQQGRAYVNLGMCGEKAPILFTAEESYGSKSTSYLWSVEDSAPVTVDAGLLEGFSYGGNGEFYSYPSALDMYADGTGHTWKQYYFFMEGFEMREYGGIYISRAELEEFAGARQILESAEGEGYVIGEIIYRGNGVINVNMCRDGYENENLTLRYDETSVVDTGDRFGGIYELASEPSRAVYPQGFVHPSAGNGEVVLKPIVTAAPPVSDGSEGFVPQVVDNGDGSYAVDLGCDGSMETIWVYQKRIEYDNEEIQYVMEVYGQNGVCLLQSVLTSWGAISDQNIDAHVRIAQTAPNELYIEVMTHLDGTSIDYDLYNCDESILLPERSVNDPGYSDGEGLYSYDEVLYENNGEEINGKYSDGLSALNGEFNQYGLRFAAQDVTFHHGGENCNGSYNIAEIPQEQLICELYKNDILARDGAAAPSITTDDDSATAGAVPVEARDQTVRIEGGSANVRSGPGLDYESVGSLKEGRVATYLGESSTDARGVAWHHINFEGLDGWVSSKYGKLIG